MARLLKLQVPAEIYGSPPSPPTAWSTVAFALSTPPTPSIAYPPIYLSPSSDAFTPSPSTLSAVSPSPNRSLSKASVVGVSVAAVVTLAVASAVLSTAAGKVGASCLLTPALNVLSSLFSKSDLCPHWNSKKDNFDDDDGGGGATGDGTEDLIEIDLYEALGDPILGEAGSGAAESIATGTLQDVVKGDFGQYSMATQALISTSMSKFAASEMKKHESIIEPVNEIAREADYAQPFLSTASIGDFAASESIMKQGTALIDEVVSRGDQRIISTRASNILSTYSATELKKHEFMLNEVVRVNDVMSRYAATESKKHDFIADEVFEACQRPATSERMITYAATADQSKKQDLTPAGGLMETVSEKSVQEKGGISEREIETKGSGAGKSSASAVAPAGGKGNTSGGGGGEARRRTGAAAAVPAKTMQATTGKPTLMHGNAPIRAMEPVPLANNKARRNPTNLGHVSLSCEISTHRLRFFAFCNSGGTYGSMPPS